LCPKRPETDPKRPESDLLFDSARQAGSPNPSRRLPADGAGVEPLSDD
jgi:hypothetical protein